MIKKYKKCIKSTLFWPKADCIKGIKSKKSRFT